MSSILNEAWIKIFGENGEYDVPDEGLNIRFGKYNIPNELQDIVKAHKAGKILQIRKLKPSLTNGANRL